MSRFISRIIQFDWFSISTFGISLLAVVYVVLNLLGYSNLAIVLSVDILQTIMLSIFLLAIHFAIKNAVQILLGISMNEEDDDDSKLWQYWIMVAADLSIIVFWFLMMLMLWGLDSDSLTAWLYLITFTGVKVGSASFSITYLLKAIAIFFVVYYAMRLLLKLIEVKVFPYTHFDQGTKDAISTIFGYAGLLFAIVMGVYALGISSTSLAFIVSAFTFGLSFGLKEIFNNFISGVILFIERPIKVGDWVDVAGEKGVVKNIKLRATTVETFSRKTLLIPNSQFITSVVSNDLYNPVARSSIMIEAGYDDNPNQVKEVLLEVAKSHKKVMKKPEPSVIFSDFGESGLAFELRFFCMTEARTNVTSELRYAIVAAFSDAGLEIPYPKRDLYIKENPSK